MPSEDCVLGLVASTSGQICFYINIRLQRILYWLKSKCFFPLAFKFLGLSFSHVWVNLDTQLISVSQFTGSNCKFLICEIVLITAVDSKNLMPPGDDEIKDGQWLGVTVRSMGPGKKVMVCSLRSVGLLIITCPIFACSKSPRFCNNKKFAVSIIIISCSRKILTIDSVSYLQS